MITMEPRGATVLISASGRHGPLPTAEALLAAVQGHLDNDTAVAAWARQLGVLQQQTIAEPDAQLDINTQIGGLIADIDAHICRQLPRPRPGVPRGTESLGGVIARMAEAWACADWALHRCNDPIHWHHAWEHLAEIHQAYEDLGRLAIDGAVILPKSWPGITWAATHSRSLSAPTRDWQQPRGRDHE